VFVVVDVRRATVGLVEPGDFSRLHLEVRGGFDEGAVDLLLGNAGRVDSVEHAFLTVDGLRSLAGDVADDEWEQGLRSMVEYARGRGWLDQSGSAVRAHIEWPPDSVA
jgi:hypothetical protein